MPDAAADAPAEVVSSADDKVRRLIIDRVRFATEEAKRAYQMCAAALGADSPDALDAQVLVGIALRSGGWPDEAASQFEDALRKLSVRFGATSNDALACRLSRAANLQDTRSRDWAVTAARGSRAAGIPGIRWNRPSNQNRRGARRILR